MSRTSIRPGHKSVLVTVALLGLLTFVLLVCATAALASFRLEYVEGVKPRDGIRIHSVHQVVPNELKRATVTVSRPPVLRAASGGVNWDALAGCESTHDWGINTGNGYYGGLQMTHSNWLNHRPPGSPSHAHLATKEQQIHAAEGILREQGRGAWPPLGRPECN